MTFESEMTDGPHKSLSMRRAWKHVAERADRPAFTPDEVCEKLVVALQQDWKAEVPPDLLRELRGIVCDRQGILFDDGQRDVLEALRPLAAGHTFGSVFLDFAVMAVASGYGGEEALVRAARDTIADVLARSERQIEEHYLRRCEWDRVSSLLTQLRIAKEKIDYRSLAAALLGHGDADMPAQAPARPICLDDGVML